MRSLATIVSIISALVIASTAWLHYKTREAAEKVLLSRALDRANTFALAAKAAPLDDGILNRMSAEMVDDTVIFACLYKPNGTHLCGEKAPGVSLSHAREVISRVIRSNSFSFGICDDHGSERVFELWFPVRPGSASNFERAASEFSPGPKEEKLWILLLQLDTRSGDRLVTQSLIHSILITLLLGLLIVLTVRQLRLFNRDRAFERELAEQRRFAELGRLSAVLAHEIRNPLGAIKGFAQFTRNRFKEGDPQREDMETIVAESTRLERLVKELLVYAKPQQTHKTHFDMQHLGEQLVKLMEFEAGQRGVGVSFQAGENPIGFFGDEDQLIQAGLNIMMNAVDAMGEGGKLDVFLSETDTHVVIAFRDSGSGIPKDVLPDIFEPFFTRKASGTGLGLSVARRIVKAHGGDIEVDASSQNGACFALVLPKEDGVETN